MIVGWLIIQAAQGKWPSSWCGRPLFTEVTRELPPLFDNPFEKLEAAFTPSSGFAFEDFSHPVSPVYSLTKHAGRNNSLCIHYFSVSNRSWPILRFVPFTFLLHV